MSEKVNSEWTSLNANELIEFQGDKASEARANGFSGEIFMQTATLLRQQQAEIEELKLAKKVILRYAEKDIAKYRTEVEELKKQLALWRLSKSSEEIEQVPTNPTLMGGLDEPVGHFYPEGEGATIYDIKFAWKVTGTTEPIPLYTHEQITPLGLLNASEPIYPAKTLIDSEILDLWTQKNNLNGAKDVVDFARAILKKEQEK